jgi:tRNA1(Val) A37 N6-methylase TrmN6
VPEFAGLTETFDHVIANPPYYDSQRGTLADDPQRAAAHAMPDGELESWARFMAAMAKPRGTLTMVHRADALGEILRVLDSRFGGLKIRPVHARETEPATRILVHGIKGSRAPLLLLPALVLYDAGGGTRGEVEAVLRGGGGLRW